MERICGPLLYLKRTSKLMPSLRQANLTGIFNYPLAFCKQWCALQILPIELRFTKTHMRSSRIDKFTDDLKTLVFKL